MAKWRWAGKRARKDDNRWTHRQERVGDDKDADGGTSLHNVCTTWARLAQDRCRWLLHEEGYTRLRWNSQQGKARLVLVKYGMRQLIAYTCVTLWAIGFLRG